jgi:hypothetical protein
MLHSLWRLGIFPSGKYLHGTTGHQAEGVITGCNYKRIQVNGEHSFILLTLPRLWSPIPTIQRMMKQLLSSPRDCQKVVIEIKSPKTTQLFLSDSQILPSIVYHPGFNPPFARTELIGICFWHYRQITSQGHHLQCHQVRCVESGMVSSRRLSLKLYYSRAMHIIPSCSCISTQSGRLIGTTSLYRPLR